MTERLLSDARLAPGDRVLELASGPGGAGLAAAVIVGDDGQVVISDVVAEMAAIAARRASALGLRNVTTAVLDLEAIDQPDNAYDAVICREGLMFAVQPTRALQEIHRVLRPHGTVALSVWGSQAANPWLGIVTDAVTAVTGHQTPPAGMPGPFALADPAELVALMERAGFDRGNASHIDVPLRAPSFDAWWARTKAVAGPVAGTIARLDPATTDALERHLRDAVEAYRTDTGIDLPGVAIVASGRATTTFDRRQP